MRLRYLAATILAAAVALAASAAAAAAPEASAQALALLVRLPGGEEIVVGRAAGPPGDAAIVRQYADAAVSFDDAWTEVRRRPGADAGVEARATVEALSLLDGLVTAEGLAVRAAATADERSAAGELVAVRLTGLRVAGEELEARPNRRVSLGDVGYAVLLEQAVLRDGSRAYRGFVAAVHVHLDAPHADLPAGTEILVGYAEAAAEAPPSPAPAPPPVTSSGSGGREEPAPPPPGAKREPPPIVRDPPPAVEPRITGAGYVFPVYGPVSFGDDFGAPRATTGWHHGVDVFAPLGAPVLAVADGTVYAVGWNPVGGWRLWLRDGSGNEFYYAHLSAFSPLAVDGARVRAGDVLGFVGDSGDAAGTPHHLHFEVHPAALLGLGYDGVVNPYPYLLAWHERRDESLDAGLAAGPAPRPGAVLVEAEDISTASGLEPGAVERALGLGEPLLYLPAAPPPLVGAEAPGFAAAG